MLLDQNKRIFLNNCLKVIDTIGTKCHTTIFNISSDGIIYTDELIHMEMSSDEMYMLMTRKRNNNNFFYLYNGTIIRFDSDYIYLDEHIQNILQGFDNVRKTI